MVDIATGLWRDHTKPAVLAVTLTLSVDHGNLLLAVLAILVTVTSVSFWNITAFALYTWKVRNEPVSALDLQHRVNLCNNRGALSSAWEALKLHYSWSAKRLPKLIAKTSTIVVPAILVWVAFAAAATLSSRVANKSYGSVIVRVQEHNCGIWQFNTTNPEGMTAYLNKKTTDTTQARTYVSNFYANSSSTLARSAFVRPTLPYTTNTTAACPLVNTSRCILGQTAAFSMTTNPLDSHDMLGINADPEDRVTLQKHVTCAQVRAGDLVNIRHVDKNETAFTLLEYHLGPNFAGKTDYTYHYNTVGQYTDATYILVPHYHLAQDPDPLWEPIPDLKRDDADISIFFLSQNSLAYLSAVHDRWFLANGTYNISIPGAPTMDYLPNAYVSVMFCADQHRICNPSTSTCTPLAGLHQTTDSALSRNTLTLNPRQLTTAGRLLVSLIESSTYESVAPLGAAGALWANNLVTVSTSPGLPDNQWQREVLGWFQTGLAKLQAYVVDYTSNDGGGGLSRFRVAQQSVNANVANLDESNRLLRDQCGNQLIQMTGEVQNFSFLGVMVIVCVSAFLVLLDWSLGSVVEFAGRFVRWAAVVGEARRADGVLDLLRAVLEGRARVEEREASWERGALGVPVMGDPGVRLGMLDHSSGRGVNG